jgi:WD40 repeat protein
VNARPDDGAGPVHVRTGAEGGYSVDARGGMGVQVGDRNIQINYAYNGLTLTDGVAPPPLVSVSGVIDSPYRGLGAFEEKDAPFFFGREEAATALLGRLSRLAEGPGLLVVSGVSGAGKSSLLRAGVLPRIRGAGLASVPGAASWPCLVFTPGREPLDELALRVGLLAGADAAAVRRGLDADPGGFALTARQAALTSPPLPGAEPGGPAAERPAGQRRLLLVVDQFEQVFTQCPDEGQRQAFITALCAAADAGPGPGHPSAALVVLGVRADFEARCANYPALAGAVQDRYLVTAMTERQLRMAITEPAKTAGSRVDEDLVEVLLAEVRARQPGVAGAGVLPLLSHALDQAWRSKTGPVLTPADYERTGGIEGAVADSAQRAYDQLTPGQQVAARQVFTRLTAAASDGLDTADRATRGELTQGKNPAQAGDVAAVLEAFAGQRLLTLAADSVEISHEVLLTAWPLLRDTWLTETHADRIIRTRLHNVAAEWARQSRDSSYLYGGTLLQAAVETAARTGADPARNPPLSQIEQDFLYASDHARRRTKRWRRGAIVGLAVLTLIAFVLSVLADQQRAAAIGQRDQAIENQIVAEAEQLSATDPSLAAQLLLTAYRRDPSQDLASRLTSTENQPLSTSEITSGTVGSTGFSVAFSPDGKTLAAGDGGSSATLWDVSHPARPRQLSQPLAGDSSLAAVAFSPDGRILAAGDDNVGGSVRLWDVSDPARPRMLGRPLTASDGVAAMAFSPDGKTLAAGDGDGTVQLWNVTDPARPRKLGRPLAAGNGNGVSSLAFSPDGDILAVGDDGLGSATVWDVRDPSRAHQLGQPLIAVQDNSRIAVAFSPAGDILATGDASGPATLWYVGDPAQPIQRGPSLIPANGSGVAAVAFSPDGMALAAGDNDGTVELWDISDPGQPSEIGQPLTSGNGGLAAVAFSPDGTTLATGDNDGTVRLWSVPQTTLPANVKVLAFSPDGTTLAAGDNDGTVELWNVSDPARPRQLGQPLTADEDGSVELLAFSPDSTTLAANAGNGIELWDVSDPARPRQLGQFFIPGNGYVVDAMAFSPHGKILATGASDGSATLWNVSHPAQPSQLSQLLPPGGYGVYFAAFSPNGNILATSDGSSVELWNVSDPARPSHFGQPLTPANGSGVAAMAFSPDGTTLATGDTDGSVELWNVGDPARPSQLGQPLSTGGGYVVDAVAFSPHGTTLATGESGNVTRIWNLDVSNAIIRICDLTSGALTPRQWHQYIPQLQYDPPCLNLR